MNEEFTLNDLLSMLWTHRTVIIITSLIFGIFFFCYSNYFVKETYTANGVLYVSNQEYQFDAEDDSIQKSDIESARALSITYMETLKTRSFLTHISNITGNKYSWKSIKKKLEIKSVNETELLSVSFTSYSKTDAYNIANAIINNASDKLSSVFKGGKVYIVDTVIVPEKPDEKNTFLKTLLGIFIGAVFSAICAFLIDIYDTKIHKSEDVANRYNVSILGKISQ